MKAIRLSKIIQLILLLSFLAGSNSADAWYYDFNTGDDLSAFTIINPSGDPTYSLTETPGTLQMNIPPRSGNEYNGYDLWSTANRDALRFYRGIGSESFVLETKINVSSSGTSYYGGLYLLSDDGNYYNDLMFGAHYLGVKVDLGEPDTHPYTYQDIGAYSDLYLQVTYDGVNEVKFNYKKSQTDVWSNHLTVTGYTFDNVGIIAKTWGHNYNSSPSFTANFDYLSYNATVVPEPLSSILFIVGGFLLTRRRFLKRQNKTYH
jgi:hypothetical protein